MGSAGSRGFIVNCGTDNHCASEHLGTGFLKSISGTADGKRLWAVGFEGSMWYYEAGKWRRLTIPTLETLSAVFATRNAEKIFAVGDYGTILRSDNGQDWKIQRSPTHADLSSVFFAQDGLRGWIVGDDSFAGSRIRPAERSGGKILQTTDGGEHWAERIVSWHPRVISGTPDGKTLWVGGDVSWLGHSTNDPAVRLKTARLTGTPERGNLMLTLSGSPIEQEHVHISLSALNDFKYKKHQESQTDFKYTLNRQGDKPNTWVASLDPSDLEISSGTIAHFYIDITEDGFSQVYEFAAPYDPWRWFIDHRTELAVLATIFTVFSTLWLFWIFHPLWNLRLYFALKQPPIERLFHVPFVGPALELIFAICTVGLPAFVVHSRMLDAWIAEHRSIIEGFWGEQTIPARAAVSERQRSIEATPYVALPLRIGDPSSGTLISQPTSDEIAKLISEKRTVIQVIGPGGLGKPP